MLDFFTKKKKKEEIDDWETLHSFKGHWKINGKYGANPTYKECTYEIKFSDSRDDFQILIGGHNPQEHKLIDIAKKIVRTYLNAIKEEKDLLELKEEIDKEIAELK